MVQHCAYMMGKNPANDDIKWHSQYDGGITDLVLFENLRNLGWKMYDKYRLTHFMMMEFVTTNHYYNNQKKCNKAKDTG